MQTECIPDIFGFEAIEGREVIAAFDGGAITSNAGALLLGATDRAIRMVDRLASCFVDRRSQAQVVGRDAGSGYSPSRSATRTSTTMRRCATIH
jgi:hypothetical protein